MTYTEHKILDNTVINYEKKHTNTLWLEGLSLFNHNVQLTEMVNFNIRCVRYKLIFISAP